MQQHPQGARREQALHPQGPLQRGEVARDVRHHPVAPQPVQLHRTRHPHLEGWHRIQHPQNTKLRQPRA